MKYFSFFFNWYGWVVFYEQEKNYFDLVSIMVTINFTINFIIIFSVGVQNYIFLKKYLQVKEAPPPYQWGSPGLHSLWRRHAGGLWWQPSTCKLNYFKISCTPEKKMRHLFSSEECNSSTNPYVIDHTDHNIHMIIMIFCQCIKRYLSTPFFKKK